VKPVPGWITLYQAIDRLCCRKFQLEYLKLIKASKNDCRIVFRDLETLLLGGKIETRLIANNTATDFTVFDMHLSPFRIHFRLNDWPGIEVARNKDHLSDLLINEKDFELAYVNFKKPSAKTLKVTREDRKEALLNILLVEMKNQIFRNRKDVREQARAEYHLSIEDADAARQGAARQSGNEHLLKGGRPAR